MHRKWIPNLLKLENINYIKTMQNYKLLSYNILGQDLLVEHIHLYHDIDNESLRWESRIKKIKDEVSYMDPDILCLQEMQHDHLKQVVKHFNISKQTRKLEYVFRKKTGSRTDGCVIIYDKNKFKLISEHCVEYYTVGVPLLNRENIAVMVKLQPKNNSNLTFVVATTHLLYNPKREDVRIAQINKLIQEIINFSRVNQDFERNIHLPVILTGDFNLTPDTKAFEILTTSHSTKLYAESQCAQNKHDYFQLEAIDFGNNTASTLQHQWITVDFILKSRSQYEQNSILVNSTYQLPSIADCCKNGKIPNKYVGSDHYSLAINFKII